MPASTSPDSEAGLYLWAEPGPAVLGHRRVAGRSWDIVDQGTSDGAGGQPSRPGRADRDRRADRRRRRPAHGLTRAVRRRARPTSAAARRPLRSAPFHRPAPLARGVLAGQHERTARRGQRAGVAGRAASPSARYARRVSGMSAQVVGAQPARGGREVRAQAATACSQRCGPRSTSSPVRAPGEPAKQCSTGRHGTGRCRRGPAPVAVPDRHHRARRCGFGQWYVQLRGLPERRTGQRGAPRRGQWRVDGQLSQHRQRYGQDHAVGGELAAGVPEHDARTASSARAAPPTPGCTRLPSCAAIATASVWLPPPTRWLGSAAVAATWSTTCGARSVACHAEEISMRACSASTTPDPRAARASRSATDARPAAVQPRGPHRPAPPRPR